MKPPKDLGEFVELVAEMRMAQKSYFKDRKQSDLKRSKELEKLVDDFIKDLPF